MSMHNVQHHNITVSVHIELVDGHSAVPGPNWLAAAVRHGLAQILASDTQGQVSLLITDDATIRELNHKYRGLDETTDVLSFSAEHAGHWEGDESHHDTGADWPSDWPAPENEPPPLGDIAISLPEAIRQAEQQGVPLCRELALLLVHGALHLMGHDHYDDTERDVMQRLERVALREIFGCSEP